MHKNNRAMPRQHQIGRARQSGAMQPVAQPARKQRLAQRQFGRSVFRPNARHDSAAGGRVDGIGHRYGRSRGGVHPRPALILDDLILAQHPPPQA